MPTPGVIDASQIPPERLEAARVANIGSGTAPGMVPLVTDSTGQVPPAEVVPPEQVQAASAPPATPTRFVSAPAAQNPFAVVGTMPGGTTVSSSRTDLGKAGQEALKASDAAYAKEAGAIDKQQSVAEQQATVDAEHYAARAQVLNDAAVTEQARAEKARVETEATLKSYHDGLTDYNDSVKHLDPNRYWARQSTGEKIGNLLSIALSGVGQVFTALGHGGQTSNQAADAIDKAIDRDIDMQKTAVEAKARGANLKANAYMIAREKGASEAQAAALAKADGLQRADADAAAKAAKIGTPQAQAQGDALRAQLQQRRADELMKVAQMQATQTQVSQTSQPVLAGQLAAGQAAEQRKAAGLVEPNPNLETPLGQAADATTRKELADKYVELKRFDDSVKKLEVMTKAGWASRALSPTERQAFDRAKSGVTSYLASKDFANTGASMTPEEYKLKVEPFLPGGTAWSSGTGKDKEAAAALRELADRQRKSLQEAYTVKTHL